jgi:hypothetical protein
MPWRHESGVMSGLGLELLIVGAAVIVTAAVCAFESWS